MGASCFEWFDYLKLSRNARVSSSEIFTLAAVSGPIIVFFSSSSIATWPRAQIIANSLYQVVLQDITIPGDRSARVRLN